MLPSLVVPQSAVSLCPAFTEPCSLILLTSNLPYTCLLHMATNVDRSFHRDHVVCCVTRMVGMCGVRTHVP
jgi:hypothetical protein